MAEMSHQGIPDIKSVVGMAVGCKKESATDSTDARDTYLKNSTYRERMREINIERLDNDSFVYRNFRLIQQKHPRSVVVEMSATNCGAIVASLTKQVRRSRIARSKDRANHQSHSEENEGKPSELTKSWSYCHVW